MPFSRLTRLHAVFQNSTARRLLQPNRHGKVCCVLPFERRRQEPASQEINTRLFSCQHGMTILSGEPPCYSGFSSLFNRRQYCSAPEIDVISGMPMKHPEKGDLVYSGPLGKMIKGVKVFSLSTSLIGLSLQPYLILQSQGHSLIAKLAVGVTVSFFVFITPLLIHWVSKKYVTDCYLNKETNVYTASTYSLFLRRKELQFTPEEVVAPDVPGMFTSIIVRGKHIFMDPKMFYSKQAYILMMGYDKPIEWEVPNPNQQNDDMSQKSTKT